MTSEPDGRSGGLRKRPSGREGAAPLAPREADALDRPATDARSGGRATITVGGLPGTGTTTLCRLLEQRLGLPFVYAGALFRAEAQRRGLSLEEFGQLCQTDPSVDRGLDLEQVRLLEAGGLILEGRLSGWLAHDRGIQAFKVWVTCDEDERLRRIVERDGGSVADQAQRTRRREASEADRYARYYGADLEDLRPYDLVLDSTRQRPEELADAVVAALRTV